MAFFETNGIEIAGVTCAVPDNCIPSENFVERYNYDLCNDLSNLLNRTVSMINKYFGGQVPKYNGTPNEVDKELEEYAKNNLTRANEAIDHVKTFYRIAGNKPANQVSLSDLQKYISYRKNQKIKNNKNKYVSNASINREMDDIRRCFSIAKINKKIKVNPCDDLIDLRIENPTKRYLTKEEEKKLLEHANPIMKVIIVTALHTGMRKSEIINLKWSDVFLDEGYLIALNTKNGRSRELIITPKMKEGLSGLSKLSEYVFTSPVTKTKYADFKSTFSRTVKRAKIPYITFHELRHTTASRLNELGVDLATIQEYLDHSDAKVTQKYIHKPRKNIIDAIVK